jgi:cellulose biosynthesis protein BcsQ
MKKRIDLILNAKGGVGKSFFAVNFVQYLKDKKLPHVAIDTDNANSTLKRAHDEALYVNLNLPSELDLATADCRGRTRGVNRPIPGLF